MQDISNILSNLEDQLIKLALKNSIIFKKYLKINFKINKVLNCSKFTSIKHLISETSTPKKHPIQYI